MTHPRHLIGGLFGCRILRAFTEHFVDNNPEHDVLRTAAHAFTVVCSIIQLSTDLHERPTRDRPTVAQYVAGLGVPGDLNEGEMDDWRRFAEETFAVITEAPVWGHGGTVIMVQHQSTTI